MIMTSSQQQSFLNTGGNNPPQRINPSTPNSNPSPTIPTFRPPQLQTPQNVNLNALNNTQNPTTLMQQFQQQHLQMLQQQYLRNTPMMNPTFNLMNSMGNMSMISPGTPSLPMTIPSPNVIPNVSSTNTPRQQYPTHNIHSLYHQHQHYMHQDTSMAQTNLTPQQRPQTPITTIGGTSVPSVASITSFTPSMASIGPNTMMSNMSTMGNMGMPHAHPQTASGNFGTNNPHNQHRNDVPQQQQTRFTPIGGGGPPNNHQNNPNNERNQHPNDDGDDKQSNDAIDDHPSAVLGQPPNSIIVNVSSNNKYGLRNYLVRARRILRLAKKCRICGIGSAVSVACEVTEVLKRECVAEVFSINTGLIEDDQSTRPTLEIVVKRGRFAHLVSDFRRRKVIEVFEKKDKTIGGVLSFDFIRKMDLPSKFKADTYRSHQAQHYLQRLEGDPETEAVDLPKFIHYCSIIIHPLLLEYHFKMAIAELGGYVDVHDGHLPREHTEDKVEQLQKLGRIDPFLNAGDDIVFNPQDFRHWFHDRSHHNHRVDHRVEHPSNHMQQHTVDTQSPEMVQSQHSSQYATALNHNHNHNPYNNRGITHAHTQYQDVRTRTRAPPQYPTPMRIYDDVDIKTETHDNTASLEVIDDNTTTNAVDGSVVTNTVTEHPVQDIIKRDDHDHDPIPEDESITQDVNDNKEITQKIDNMTEEDDGSQVQPPSDTSKPTTGLSALSVDTEN